MNATLDTSIATEAARSTIERHRLKNAIGRYFLRNAANRAGVPVADSDVDVNFQVSGDVEEEPEEEVEQVVQQPHELPISIQVTHPSYDPYMPLKFWVLAVAVVIIAVTAFFSGKSFSQSTTTNTTEIKQQHEWQSPFQYLEDRGGHLP